MRKNKNVTVHPNLKAAVPPNFEIGPAQPFWGEKLANCNTGGSDVAYFQPPTVTVARPTNRYHSSPTSRKRTKGPTSHKTTGARSDDGEQVMRPGCGNISYVLQVGSSFSSQSVKFAGRFSNSVTVT